MNDRKIRKEDQDSAINSNLSRDDSSISSDTLTNTFIQRGRLDLRLQEKVAIHLQQGADALNARDFKKAIDAFLAVLQLNKDSAEAHFHLGLAYFMLEDYEKAIDAYKMAILCEPLGLDVYINLASTYRVLKRYDKAIEVYERAILLMPNRPELHSELGAVYSLQGKRNEAVKAFKTAMRLKLKSKSQYLSDEVKIKRVLRN